MCAKGIRVDQIAQCISVRNSDTLGVLAQSRHRSKPHEMQRTTQSRQSNTLSNTTPGSEHDLAAAFAGWCRKADSRLGGAKIGNGRNTELGFRRLQTTYPRLTGEGIVSNMLAKQSFPKGLGSPTPTHPHPHPPTHTHTQMPTPTHTPTHTPTPTPTCTRRAHAHTHTHTHTHTNMHIHRCSGLFTGICDRQNSDVFIKTYQYCMGASPCWI